MFGVTREEETQNIGTYFWPLSKYRKIFTGRQRARAHARLKRPCARKSTRASLAPVRRSAHASQAPVHKGARAPCSRARACTRAAGGCAHYARACPALVHSAQSRVRRLCAGMDVELPGKRKSLEMNTEKSLERAPGKVFGRIMAMSWIRLTAPYDSLGDEAKASTVAKEAG